MTNYVCMYVIVEAIEGRSVIGLTFAQIEQPKKVIYWLSCGVLK